MNLKQMKKMMMAFAVISSPVVISEMMSTDVEASNKLGWIKSSTGAWYYYDTKGNAVKNKWIGNYYLGSTGVMETNKWIGNYYVDTTGKWVSTRALESKKTGWQKVGSSWNYYDSKGNMVKNKWIGNYYLGSTGVMETNKWIGNYYVDATGKWDSTVKRDIDYKKTGWQKQGTIWYYYDSKGNMVKNKWIGNYYLGSTGVMETNKWIGNYYVDATGKWVSTRKLESKKTGWQKVGTSWNYYDSKGNMVKNKWIGNYYLGSTGVMETNKWIGSYYVNSLGEWDSTVKSTANSTVQSPSNKGNKIYQAALAQLGKKQDCTMLVTNALKSVGINFHDWPAGYKKLGTIIPASHAKPGDLIYYPNGGLGLAHIAVYAGNGQAVHGGWNGNSTVLNTADVGYGAQYIRVK